MKLVRKHRRYSDAAWALPEDRLVPVEAVTATIAPKSPELSYRALFAQQDWALYEEKGNYEQQDANLNARRCGAVSQILSNGGLAAVTQFAQTVESPSRVGVALGAIEDDKITTDVLPSLLKPDDQRKLAFARGYIFGCFQRKKWTWVDQLDTTSWSAEEIAEMLGVLPFSPEAWQRASAILGNEVAKYWRTVSVNPYQALQGLTAAVQALIQHGRPRAAIDCFAAAVHQKHQFETQPAVSALIAALSSDESPSAMHVDSVVTVIQALQNDETIDSESLLAVEWAYLPILRDGNGASPRFLESRICSDPSLFCELIRTAFRARNKPKSDSEPTEEQRSKAEHAYQLLQELERIPGTDSKGALSGDNFLSWITEVKGECSNSGHLEIAMHLIGQVLVHCPADPDGFWIHRSVAGALDSPDMNDLREGYRIGVFNSRGMHHVDPTGKPEIELARKFNQRAEQIENAGLPRFASTLRELGDSYKREAQEVISESRSEREVDRKE